ncbi:MAG TPA: hypothetical protein VM782_23110, partial [Stellaceae bacterium]|nr:hypothetical protein [Stellaceae bacterium]
MTFRIFEGTALAVVGEQVAPPDEMHIDAPVINLVSLFRLHDLSAGRTLACRWRRELDGRLACHWEPDIVTV